MGLVIEVSAAKVCVRTARLVGYVEKVYIDKTVEQ